MKRKYSIRLRTDVIAPSYIPDFLADEFTTTYKFILFKLKGAVVTVIRTEIVDNVTSTVAPEE